MVKWMGTGVLINPTFSANDNPIRTLDGVIVFYMSLRYNGHLQNTVVGIIGIAYLVETQNSAIVHSNEVG